MSPKGPFSDIPRRPKAGQGRPLVGGIDSRTVAGRRLLRLGGTRLSLEGGHTPHLFGIHLACRPRHSSGWRRLGIALGLSVWRSAGLSLRQWARVPLRVC